MVIPKILNFTWFGKLPTPPHPSLESVIAKWQEAAPDYQIRIWTAGKLFDVPPRGVEIIDIRDDNEHTSKLHNLRIIREMVESGWYHFASDTLRFAGMPGIYLDCSHNPLAGYRMPTFDAPSGFLLDHDDSEIKDYGFVMLDGPDNKLATETSAIIKELHSLMKAQPPGENSWQSTTDFDLKYFATTHLTGHAAFVALRNLLDEDSCVEPTSFSRKEIIDEAQMPPPKIIEERDDTEEWMAYGRFMNALNASKGILSHFNEVEDADSDTDSQESGSESEEGVEPPAKQPRIIM